MEGDLRQRALHRAQSVELFPIDLQWFGSALGHIPLLSGLAPISSYAAILPLASTRGAAGIVLTRHTRVTSTLEVLPGHLVSRIRRCDRNAIAISARCLKSFSDAGLQGLKLHGDGTTNLIDCWWARKDLNLGQSEIGSLPRIRARALPFIKRTRGSITEAA